MKENDVNPFLADVYALKLRTPVPMIAMKTGDSKVNVNAWIRGRQPPSPDFMVRFYAAFKNELAQKGIHRDVKNLVALLPPAPEKVTDREFLRSINLKLDEFNGRLNGLTEQLKRIEHKLDDVLRRKDKEIAKAAKDYLLTLMSTLRSSEG